MSQKRRGSGIEAWILLLAIVVILGWFTWVFSGSGMPWGPVGGEG